MRIVHGREAHMSWWVLCFESWNLSCFDGCCVLNLETYHVLMGVVFWILKLIMFWWVLCFESWNLSCFESWNLSCFDGCCVLNLETYHVLMGVMFPILKTSHALIIVMSRVSFAHTLSCCALNKSPKVSRFWQSPESIIQEKKLQNWCKLGKLWFPENIHHSPISRKKWDFREKERTP
jgi:hypothetical protein